MFKNSTILFLLLITCFSSCGQENDTNYDGNWEGSWTNLNAFNFKILLEDLSSNAYNITIANDTTLITQKLMSISDDHIKLSINNHISLNLERKNNGNELSGFISAGRLVYHIVLKKTEDNLFAGTWNLLMTDDGLKSNSVLLSVFPNDDGTVNAYPFIGDQRFSGFWADDFTKQDNVISFRCLKTGLKFRAKLLEEKIILDVLFSDIIVSSVTLIPSTTEWKQGIINSSQNQNSDTPKQLNDGWLTENIKESGINHTELVHLIDTIVNTKHFENTHSVLIAKDNKLVFEAYFDGYNATIPHDLRSASKSISSAMIGIAIDDGILESVDQKLYEFIPATYQYTKDSLKTTITIKDLLTMSSGLDVNGIAEEGNYQESNNWLKTVLEAPLVNEPGTYTDYGSANPFLLGIVLNERLEKPLETYMKQKLFEPLGITNYINQTDDNEATPYFGGGLHLTPRDMLKFGQLYLNKGMWNGQRIISEEWVNDSFKKLTRLEDVKEKNEYGYFWWHNTYIINGKKIESIEARGAGGQYIFVIPELEVVVVITSGNFRNSKTRQPEKILEEYILPAIVK